MKKTSLALWILILATSTLSAQTPPSYAKDVRPFLAKYCLECHNAKAHKGGLSLETFKAILEGSDKGPVFIAGQPDQSTLVTAAEGKSKPIMPPKTAKFHPKADEVALVRAWITGGAKDDSNLIKVVIPDIKPRKLTAAPITSVVYAADGSFLALGRYKRLELIDLKTWEMTDYPQPGNITSLAFNAHRAWLALASGSAGEQGSLLFHGLAKSLPVPPTFGNVHHDAILDLAISPDGKFLASSGYDMLITLIPVVAEDSTPSLKRARLLKEHSDAVYAIAFSPDSKLLASCSADRAVKVWDVATATLLYTLSDATDWLYTLAWSPDGQHLSAAGVDKSIRVYKAGPAAAKIVHSVFAHERPVQKIVYSKDGKTLYSLGQDQIVKAWDAASMVERKVYPKLPETGLCLAVREGELAVGRYDGIVQIIDAATGKTLRELGKFSSSVDVSAIPPSDSPGTGKKTDLPATIDGKLEKAGAVHFYRFDVKKDQQLGVKAETKDSKSKMEPCLQLTDEHGKTLAETTGTFLGYTFSEAGTYALGIRDRDFRGGADMAYRLHMGEIPVVTAVFPLGVQRGTETVIQAKGVFLDAKQVTVKVPADAAPGSKIPLQVTSSTGKPLGKMDIVVGEFPETNNGTRGLTPVGSPMPVPGTANGQLLLPGQMDVWRFSATKGQRLVLETNARRLGSALDSTLEVLDAKGQPVPRALLRCQAKTYVTFRDHDSAVAGIRIEAWNELAINDMVYVGGELTKIAALPTHPDADCFFFSANGQRTGFLDTTPTHHSQNEPMYKVSLHPPGTVFPPNGYPVFTLTYRNDDGGPGYGRDSRILFDPPADGDYLARVGDARGQGGDNYGYRLTVRPPRPSFNVRLNPTNPVISRGGALPIRVSVDRIDGYEGPIQIHYDQLPPGFSAPPTTIEAGQTSTDFALYAAQDAVTPVASSPVRLIAEAAVAGEIIHKEVADAKPMPSIPGDLVTLTEQSAISVQPGQQVQLTVTIERRNGFKGRVPLEVRGLPHGVRVMDIGLNGILVNENEVRRTIVIYAEPWVQALTHPIVVLAKREGKNSEHAAKAVMLNVVGK